MKCWHGSQIRLSNEWNEWHGSQIRANNGVSDARLLHEHSRTEDRLRSPVPPSTTELILKLAMSY